MFTNSITKLFVPLEFEPRPSYIVADNSTSLVTPLPEVAYEAKILSVEHTGLRKLGNGAEVFF